MAKKPTHWDDDDDRVKEHRGVKEGEIPPETPEPLVLPQTALVTSICQVWPIAGEPQLAFGEQLEVSLETAKLWRELGYIA